MTDYTARRILLKNAGGEYLVPYTDKLERDLSDVSAEGITALLAKVHTDGAVLQYWSDDLTPTAGKTIALYESAGTLGFYLNTTGTNTATPPDQDATNWTLLPIGAGGANTDLSNLTTTGNDKFVTKDTAQTISAVKTFSAVPVMTGTLNAKDNSTNIPTTAWVRNHCATTVPTTTATTSKDAPVYIVENYKSGNNWYVKFSDGFIMQGGQYYVAGTSFVTVNLLKSFVGTDYKTFFTGYYWAQASATPIINSASGTKTKTSFQSYFASGLYVDWFACGY